jgi:iron complex outermembrane receptor protein
MMLISVKCGNKNKINKSRIEQYGKPYLKFKKLYHLFYYNGNTESVSAGAYGVTSSPNVGLRSTFTLKMNLKILKTV